MLRAPPHPLPLTMWLIADAIPRLRAVECSKTHANAELDLYRGMVHADAPPGLDAQGATQLPLMSS